MEKEYDFSKAERGKFSNVDANLHFPIYLDIDVQEIITKLAIKQKTDPQYLVNLIIKENISSYQAL